MIHSRGKKKEAGGVEGFVWEIAKRVYLKVSKTISIRVHVHVLYNLNDSIHIHMGTICIMVQLSS